MAIDHVLLAAVLAGLGGMLGWGLADFFAKKTIDEIGDVVSLVLAHLFGTAAFIALVLGRGAWNGTPPALPHDLVTWGGLAFFGTLQAAVYVLVYRGFGKGQLAVLNPIFASFSGLTALLSILFFGELVTGNLVVALIVIFGSILLLNVDVTALREKRLGFVFVPGFPEIAVATLLAAGWTILWDQFVAGRDWLLFAAVMYVFMTVVLLAVAALQRLKLQVTRPSVWVWLALIGLCETGAYAAISWGYASTPHTSVIALISGAFSLPTIVLARLVLKERTTRLQAIASLGIVAGIVLMNIS
jgi:drug/metabolite transporter (DMT)-like permease